VEGQSEKQQREAHEDGAVRRHRREVPQNKKASAIPDALKISARQFGAPVPRRRQNQEDEAIKNPDLSSQKIE
jgi:hypothetical protein